MSSSAVLEVEQLIDQVYLAVRAVMIHMMVTALKKSRKYLVDLIAARASRDNFMEYAQFESMLQEDLQVGFYPKLFEKVVIGELMDPERRHGKINVSIMKHYLAEGENGSMAVDLVPIQENKRIGARPARDGPGQREDQASVVQRKMLQQVSRKVLMGFQGTFGDVLNKVKVMF